MRKLVLLVALLCAKGVWAQQSATGNITASSTVCASTTTCISLPLIGTPVYTGATVTLAGTFSATLQPEQSADGGVTWVSNGGTLSSTGVTQLTFTGMTNFRVRCTAYVSGTVTVTIQAQIGGGGGGSVSAAPNQTVIYLSTSCATQPNCFPITSGKIVVDGVWTNNSATVTSATAGFTSAMNGWTMFGTTGGCVTGTQQEMSGGLQLPLGTLTFVNATTVTTSVTTSTITTVASGGCLIFGPIADTQIAAADTAWQSATACSPLSIDSGIFLIAAAHFITKPTTCRPLGADSSFFGQGAMVRGQGKGSTIFVPLETFNFATCTGGQSAHACMDGMIGSYFRDFAIFGGNNSRTGDVASPASNLFEMNVYSFVRDIFFAGYGAKDPNLTGMAVTNSQVSSAAIFNSTIDGFGGGTTNGGMVAIANSGLEATDFNLIDCLTNCLNIASTGGITCNYCSYEGGLGSLANSILVINAGVYKGEHDFCTENGAPSGITMTCLKNQSTGTVYVDNVSFGENVNANSLGVDNFGSIWSNKSKFYGGSAGTAINIEATGIWYAGNDQVGIAGSPLGMNTVAGGKVIADGHSIHGTCTGTANASVTNSLYGTGPNVTATTCAGQSATIGTGVVVNGARTMAGMYCDSSATTVSVACTMMKNGATTTLTCTMTAATHCVDFTHTIAIADGDLISFEIVTGAAETGANIKATAAWF